MWLTWHFERYNRFDGNIGVREADMPYYQSASLVFSGELRNRLGQGFGSDIARGRRS